MLGDLSGMMKKLKETQKKIEETKARLETIQVEGNSNNGNIKVLANANREIKSIVINDSLLTEKEALEDYLVLAVNEAINKAGKINDAELAAAAKDGLPNIPGLDMFK